MTKNIKITIIVAVVALITLIIVLSSTVFCVKQAEIVWYKEPSAALGQVSNEVLLEKSEVASQSVFFLDRNKAKNSLEDSYPDMRVIGIEVTWPNAIKVHATMREPVYCMRVKDNKYAILDEYFKVLDVLSVYDNDKTNAVYIDTDAAAELDVKKGDNISIFGARVWYDVYCAFVELERDLVDFRGIIKATKLENETMTIITHMGTTLKLDKPFANTRAKMRTAVQVFNTLTTQDYAGSVIEVFVNSSNDLESRWYKE